MSWVLKVTFVSHVEDVGKAEEEKSNPVSWQVDGSVLATSRSQIPVPVAMSAILRVDEVSGIFGWTRKPRVLVVISCCSFNLVMCHLVFLDMVDKTYLSGISSTRGKT